MPQENKHKAWLSFQRKLLDVPMNYSKDDLHVFLSHASTHGNELIARLIHDYLELASQSETKVRDRAESGRLSSKKNPREMHLFDLLREKKLFPQNSDLARFAARVMPHMKTYRFDKMSRSDIAARIIEHMENNDPRARDELERSMRDALATISGAPSKQVDRQSFLSKWEEIIKRIEF